MSDDSVSGLDFLDEVLASPEKQARKRKGRRDEEFSTGLETVSYGQAARATASKSMAGQYKRYTVYLSPEDIAKFREVAADIGLSQAETARWFFQHMFMLYEKGLRPKTEPVIVKHRLASSE
jgi:hypothetical protein